MSQSCDVFLIDGFSLLYRAYYGYPPNLTTPDGVPINAAYGFITMMLNAIDQFKPTYFGICMDLKEPTYRHQLFQNIKHIDPLQMMNFWCNFLNLGGLFPPLTFL